MRVGRPLNEHTSPFSTERALHTRFNTSKRSLSFDQFLIGGFTDPGKGYDVALCIAASLEEDPKASCS